MIKIVKIEWDKKTYVVIGIVLIIICVISYDVYSNRREANNGGGSAAVTEQFNAARAELAATGAELERSKSAARDLQAANEQLSAEVERLREINGQYEATINDLSANNSELERIAKQGTAANANGRELIRQSQQILSTVQSRESIQNN
jgi:chromosome segregation ATPase